MLITEIVILLTLIGLNGLLAMSELAVVSSRRSRLKSMVEQGIHGARRALALASDPGRFLSTVQIGITLVGIVAGAFSGATLGTRLGEVLSGQGWPKHVAEFFGIGVVISAITYLSLIAGELVPKRIALRHPEAVACLVAPSMTYLAKACTPVVWLLDVSSRTLLRLFGVRATREGEVTQEEIRTLVAEAESAGVIEPEERAMIAGVMRLGDRPVRALMTPRPDVDLIDLADGLDEVKRRIVASGHSRLPVCDGSPDNVIGVVQAKDLLNAFLQGGAVKPRDHVRAAPIVPDTMDALDVIDMLKESPVHIGLVHDEYGHFEGVVTSADILEAIAGEFRTEEGAAEMMMVRREDGSYLVSGAMPADELAERLNLTLPDERDFHTVAGLILWLFGRLPAAGDTVDYKGWRFEVVDLDGRRIDKIVASRQPSRHRIAA